LGYFFEAHWREGGHGGLIVFVVFFIVVIFLILDFFVFVFGIVLFDTDSIFFIVFVGVIFVVVVIFFILDIFVFVLGVLGVALFDTDSIGETGKEDIEPAEGGGVVRVGAAAAEAHGREGGRGGLVVDEECAEDGGRVEVAEAAAECGGRTDGAEESGAGESGADEGREGGEAEEHLAQEVVAEGEYGGRSRLMGALLPRRRHGWSGFGGGV
jgi:hypothetical protein